MYLSQILSKTLYSANSVRGACLGVGVSPKNGACKYLLCTTNPAPQKNEKQTDFTLNFSCIADCDEFQLHLSAFRPVAAKPCAKLFPALPVYSFEGNYLGAFCDAEIKDGAINSLITDTGKLFPFSLVGAINDAVILQKTKPYPIGQRIPAPAVLPFTQKNETHITRPVLQKALRANSLIKLTLSLAPFHLKID